MFELKNNHLLYVIPFIYILFFFSFSWCANGSGGHLFLRVVELVVNLYLFSPRHPLRLAQSIGSLQSFSLSADPSFRHFQLDVSRELKLITDLNFIQGENQTRCTQT